MLEVDFAAVRVHGQQSSTAFGNDTRLTQRVALIAPLCTPAMPTKGAETRKRTGTSRTWRSLECALHGFLCSVMLHTRQAVQWCMARGKHMLVMSCMVGGWAEATCLISKSCLESRPSWKCLCPFCNTAYTCNTLPSNTQKTVSVA